MGSSTYAKWKSGTRKSTKMLDREFIEAMDGFAKLFEEGHSKKLEAMEKAGVAWREQDRQLKKAKKQATKDKNTQEE